jgi:endonuclease/exonuclease/phosphatase family metal-dependent hydrolase
VVICLFSTSALADTARIATWNIEGFSAIPQSRLNKIVDGLKELDADIVVLPELNPLSHAQAIADKLSETPGQCYKATAIDQPLAHQEIGFVHKCAVTVSASELVIGSDLGEPDARNGAVIRAKIGSFDFVVIGLHLKSGRTAANRRMRNEQLKIIRAYVEGVVMGGEKDVLVIGDYNMIPAPDHENFETLNAVGTLRFVSSEDLAGGFSHISESGGAGNLLDGYGFTNIDASEYQEGSVEIVQLHERLGLSLFQFKSQVSDHLPVVAEFNVDADHDP